MEYLIAVDLEGIHGVVGEPYVGLGRALPDYAKAVEGAALEINAAAKALFESGATKVVVWDNHAGGGNIDFSQVDPRVIHYVPDNSLPRMYFLKEFHFDGILFLGYHSKEGTINGILAHTYNSSVNQYVKINGRAVGELDIDTSLAGEFGVPAIFAASDDICLRQMLECNPQTEVVITKYAKGRNAAEFRNREDVLEDIYQGVKRAVKKDVPVVKISYPCLFEIRYTRMEKAAEVLQSKAEDVPSLAYGEDAHVLTATLKNMDELRRFF